MTEDTSETAVHDDARHAEKMAKKKAARDKMLPLPAFLSMLPGNVAPEAARIDVPLLLALGESEERVARDIARFRQHDHDTLLRQQAIHRDEQQLIQTAKEAARELEQLFESDLESGAAGK